MARRRYVSIKEVAARAGVSFQTASKVLNGGDVRVSVETEERILAAAAELGYRPNTIARSLVQRASATIGLLASDATDVAIAQASVAAEQAARKNGHSVLVGHLAAGHLLRLGHTSIGTVTGLFRRRVTRSRLHGYEDALRDAGLEPSEDLVAEGDWTPRGGATATRLLLERSPGLSAIFVHSDVMAIGVLSALWQAGRRVPADVAVVSCDDIPFAEFLTPPLSTVRIPLAETGRQAVELLLRSIAGEPAPERTPLLPVELIVRDSCGGRGNPVTKERH